MSRSRRAKCLDTLSAVNRRATCRDAQIRRPSQTNRILPPLEDTARCEAPSESSLVRPPVLHSDSASFRVVDATMATAAVRRRYRSREALCMENRPQKISPQRKRLLQTVPPRRPLRRHSTNEDIRRGDLLCGLLSGKSSQRAKQNTRHISSCAFDVCDAAGHRIEPPLVARRDDVDDSSRELSDDICG